MTWKRTLTPMGVPQYRCADVPGFMIEATAKLSAHCGMVFGQYVNDAGRQTRIGGPYRIYLDDRCITQTFTLAQAKAAIERRLADAPLDDD